MNLITPQDFLSVRRPSRYIGGEYNQIKKQWSPDLVTFALAFPDLYEIGMSHLGSRIIYHILNDLSYVVCERVFAPWIDLEELLRKKNISLFSLENRKPLKEFDILGFSIGYELSYTNVLNMLDLSGIEIYSDKRKHGPIVIAGGVGAFSPEPMAPFIDLFVLGDGEEVVVEIVKAFHDFKSQNTMTRYEKLQALNRISGVYAPKFPSRIKRRVVKDLNKSPYPVRMIVPYMEVVHDRYALEIMRGCSRGCRFCQAGFLYRPVRERNMESLLELAGEGIKRTGYEEVSFLSLSSGDYSKLPELLKSFNTSADLRPGGTSEDLRMTSVSLPSLHIENITPEVVSYLKTIRKNTFTFAPETGEKRVSFAINKKFDYNKLLEMSEHLFKIGYQKIKLYFMIGLPGEGERVVEEIYNLVSEISCRRPSSARADITVSVSNFIPKPHTPFQWEKMEGLDSLWNKQMKLKELFKKMKRVKFNYHDLNSSFLEAVLSRGDRKLSSVIYEAWKAGAKFDSWRECFRYSAWQDAFKKTDIDPYFYSHRERDEDEVLPWDHIDTGIDKDFFRVERKKAGEGVESPDCRTQCLNCGVCSKFQVKNILTSGKA